jgi:hypothetical protein
MEQLDPTVAQLASLAMEIESDASINWSALTVDKEQAFALMSKNVYDQFTGIENQDEAAIVALATIVKLLVENLALKAQLQQKAANE